MGDENFNPSLSVLPPTPVRTKFAVFVPSDESLTGVYNSKAEALSVVQGKKGARFAPVLGDDEANDFFSYEKQIISTPRPPPIGVAEESCPFSTPSLFGEVMSTINRGDVEHLKRLVDSNPLFLVTKVDSPTILHQGARYNALHLCANKDLVNVARFIISLIRSGTLFSRLYPNDPPESRQARITRLIDMYLNSPDRHRAETPLHFAAKMGNADMVWLLSSQEECLLEPKNIDGKTPAEINCSRASGTCEIKRLKIESALSGQFYILILRSFANPLEPIVRKPVRASSDSVKVKDFLNSEDSKLYRVSAYVGPTSQDQSKEIYEVLSKPSRRRRRLNDSFKMDSSYLSLTPNRSLMHDPRASPMTPRRIDPCVADPRYGLENCARELALSFFVPFYECFEFLDGEGMDIRTHESYVQMDLFLKSKHLLFCKGCGTCRPNESAANESNNVNDSEAKSQSGNISPNQSEISNISRSSQFDSPACDQPAQTPSWRLITQPIKWVGQAIFGVTGYFLARPIPRQMEVPALKEDNTRTEALTPVSRQEELSDSFIEQFASMKLCSPADSSRLHNSESTTKAEFDSQNQSSNTTTVEPECNVKVFFGQAVSKPSEEDFHIYKLINEDDTFGENFRMTSCDYPFLACWYEHVRYVKENTLV